jgi:hypothetical protein
MLINADVLKGFKACSSGLDNFTKQYPKFSGSFLEVLDLKNIPYSDKIWLARKVLNKDQMVHFGLLCAESVLNIFESKYPLDKRVRDYLAYLRGIPDFSVITTDQLTEIFRLRSEVKKTRYTAADAAYAAYATDTTDAITAYAAAAATAADAAYAADAIAAYAAADAIAAYATDAITAYATDAITAYATDAAAAAATAAGKQQQQNLNLEFLKMTASL